MADLNNGKPALTVKNKGLLIPPSHKKQIDDNVFIAGQSNSRHSRNHQKTIYVHLMDKLNWIKGFNVLEIFHILLAHYISKSENSFFIVSFTSEDSWEIGRGFSEESKELNFPS